MIICYSSQNWLNVPKLNNCMSHAKIRISLRNADFNISCKSALHLILCFYFLFKRSNDLQFMNSSSFWTKLKFNAHQNYYVVQHNFASHFCLALVIVKTNPQPIPVEAQNTNFCFSVTLMDQLTSKLEVLKNTQPLKNAFPMLCYLFQKFEQFEQEESDMKGSIM